ncbi:MAG: hypothetical protein J3R72DRAFT_454516 [Linnemannia gamsii]|nr:MAG: hypothetical protein J3R72DRAFT_454516 [Linnemannia gamsii]
MAEGNGFYCLVPNSTFPPSTSSSSSSSATHPAPYSPAVVMDSPIQHWRASGTTTPTSIPRPIPTPIPTHIPTPIPTIIITHIPTPTPIPTPIPLPVPPVASELSSNESPLNEDPLPPPPMIAGPQLGPYPGARTVHACIPSAEDLQMLHSTTTLPQIRARRV